MNHDEFQRIELRFKQYIVHQVIDEEILFDVEPMVVDSIWGDVVFRLKAQLLSDDLPPETIEQRAFVHYQIPASTWQMFKKRHAQAWWLKRLVAGRPVRYERDRDLRGEHATCTFNLERFQTYPESRLRASDHGQAVRLHTFSTDWTFGGEGS